MANEGIRLIKPQPITSEQYAGLEWDLDNFIPKTILAPIDTVMYTNTKGRTSVRFTDYKEYKENESSADGESSEYNLELVQIERIANYIIRERRFTNEDSNEIVIIRERIEQHNIEQENVNIEQILPYELNIEWANAIEL